MKRYNVKFSYKVIDDKFNIGYAAEYKYSSIGKLELDALSAAYDSRSSELLNEIRTHEANRGRTYVEDSLYSMEITSLPSWLSPFIQKILIQNNVVEEVTQEEYEIKIYYKVVVGGNSNNKGKPINIEKDSTLIFKGDREVLENITKQYCEKTGELSKAISYYEAMLNRKYVEDSIYFMEIKRIKVEK